MAEVLPRVWPLYGAAATMSVGFSAIASSAPVIQHAQGVSDRGLSLAGALASAGAIVGAFVVGSGTVSRRTLVLGLLTLVGTALLGGAVVASGTVLAPWWRVADGVALGACLVACETLLLFTVDAPRRARALAIYSLSTAIGWAVGPWVSSSMVGVAPGGAWPFFLAAVAGGAATATLLVGSPADPTVKPSPAAVATTVPFATVWRRNLVPCFTTLHFGAFQATLLVVFPLHLLQAGAGANAAVSVVGAFAAGACLFTLPNAWLGQRLPTVVVMAGLCVVGGIAVVGVGVLPLVGPQGTIIRTGLAFVVGGTLATLSPLSLLMQVNTNSQALLPRANALYNAHYAIGMLLGPLLLLVLIGHTDTAVVVMAMGCLWLVHAVFVLLFAQPTVTEST